MSSVHFIPAKSGHIDYIYKLLKEAFDAQKIPHLFHHTKKSLEAAIFQQRIAEVILASKKGNFAGMAIFSITNRDFTLSEKPGIYLHDICVDRSYQRQNIGTLLLDEVVRIAVQRDCNRVDLSVFKSNIQALGFYAKYPEAHEIESDMKYLRIYCGDEIDDCVGC